MSEDSRVEIVYIERGYGKILLYGGHQYHKPDILEDGAQLWHCYNNYCVGNIILQNDRIIKQLAHICPCDYEKSRFDLEVYQLGQAYQNLRKSDLPLKQPDAVETRKDDVTTMAFDTVSISSDDDVPLKVTNSSHLPLPATIGISHLPLTTTILKEHSIQHCDFCEEVFLNKYDAFIHNAKHIIIPLMKRELHQCPLCLFYFTSRYKLKHHTRNKHRNDVIKLNNNNVNSNNDVTKGNNDKDQVNIKKHKHDNDKNKDVNEKSKGFNEESKDVYDKIVTIYESDDDDDLPLVNGNIEGTDTFNETELKCETSKLKEALLKDVKVVIEKLELIPETIKPKLSNEVPVKFEMKVKDKIADKIEHKVKTVTDEIEAKAVKAIEGPKLKVSSRLRFEDDIDDICEDTVMKDLANDCLVDMNLFDEPWFDELAKSINNDEIVVDDDIIINIDDDGKPGDTAATVTDDTVYSPSTHHDDLIKPGVYRCKKCQQMFPTRFNQIQHEMTHMHIRKPRPFLCEHCDRFIGSKKVLKDHITTKHLTQYRQRTYQNCTKCGLKYNNYGKHLEIYHEFLRCHLCNKGFQTEIDRLNHIRGHLVKIKCSQCGFVASELEIQEHKRRFHKSCVSLAQFHLCDVCCLFLRNKHNTNYVFGETVSKLGARMDCEHCGNKFFHLTQVRRTVKGRPTDRFQFEKEKEKKKVLTNKDRLKNIQQRLKMINKLSRF